MPKVLAMQARGFELDYQHPWESAGCWQRWVKRWCSWGSPSPTRKLCLQCKEKGWVRGMGRTQSRKKLALRWGWPFHSSLARRIISSLQMRVKISPGRICKEHTHLHVQRTKHSSWSVFVHSISTPFPRNCGMNTQATL